MRKEIDSAERTILSAATMIEKFSSRKMLENEVESGYSNLLENLINCRNFRDTQGARENLCAALLRNIGLQQQQQQQQQKLQQQQIDTNSEIALQKLQLLSERAVSEYASNAALFLTPSPSGIVTSAKELPLNGTSIFSPFISPLGNSACSMLSSASSSSSSASSSGDVSPTATHLLMNSMAGSAFNNTKNVFSLSFVQAKSSGKEFRQKTNERKRRRIIGNMDNTLDGLVAKRLDVDPQEKRYRSEKEAIELPDDESEMKRMATDPDVSTRMCSVCGYQGKWVSEMIRHKRVHTSERPFRCRYCNRTSKWKADLIRHVAKTHGIRVVSKYSRSKVFESKSPQLQHQYHQHSPCTIMKDDVNNNTLNCVTNAEFEAKIASFRCKNCFSEIAYSHDGDSRTLTCNACAQRKIIVTPKPQMQSQVMLELSEVEHQKNGKCSPLSIKVNFFQNSGASENSSGSDISSTSSLSAMESSSKSPNETCVENEIMHQDNRKTTNFENISVSSNAAEHHTFIPNKIAETSTSSIDANVETSSSSGDVRDATTIEIPVPIVFQPYSVAQQKQKPILALASLLQTVGTNGMPAHLQTLLLQQSPRQLQPRPGVFPSTLYSPSILFNNNGIEALQKAHRSFEQISNL